MGGKKTAGVIIREALRTYRENFGFFLITSLIVFGATYLYSKLVNLDTFPLGTYYDGIFKVLGSLFLVISINTIINIPAIAFGMNANDATLAFMSGQKTTVPGIARHFARDWRRYLGISAWSMLWQTLWYFALLIPGIVKTYAYSSAPYLVIQYPGMTVRQALKKSSQITHGYKSRLFALSMVISFPAIILLFAIDKATIPFMSAGLHNLAYQGLFFLTNLLFLGPVYYAINTIAYMDIRRAAVERGLLEGIAKRED